MFDKNNELEVVFRQTAVTNKAKKTLTHYNTMDKFIKQKYIFTIIVLSVILFSCSTVRLTKFKASGCKKSREFGLSDYIQKGNKTIITYDLGAPCGLKFKGKAKYENDTLFITAIKRDEPCRCICTYELTYEIKGLKTDTCIVKYVRNLDTKKKNKK